MRAKITKRPTKHKLLRQSLRGFFSRSKTGRSKTHHARGREREGEEKHLQRVGKNNSEKNRRSVQEGKENMIERDQEA